MNSSFYHIPSYVTYFIIFFFIIISLIIIPINSIYPDAFKKYSDSLNSDYNSEYFWPIPEYTKITSPFGKRKSPTAGASSFHKGIDIGAPENTNLYAVCDGTISFVRIFRWWWLYYHFI